jgi:hypothetical protein
VPVRTLKAAAAFVDRVGLALVFPKDDLVLPSLWEAAGGGDEYSIRDAEGNFVRWTKPMEFVWPAKSDLVSAGLVCGGKHLRRRASLVSLDALPALYAVAHDEDELEPVERDILELVREQGPATTREIPELLPQYERKRVRSAIDRLEGRLVLTNAGLEETDGWPAIVVDLVERRYAARLRKLPPRDEARRLLVERLLGAVGELSAEDVRGAFGWRKADCLAALEATDAPTRDEDGITLWTSARRR